MNESTLTVCQTALLNDSYNQYWKKIVCRTAKNHRRTGLRRSGLKNGRRGGWVAKKGSMMARDFISFRRDVSENDAKFRKN
ncbi:hypothetical protein [Siphonobacter sp. BAB-5385]|uniref:hypothetical protein n=1 Tax=Siphonobacter sp. BAB-5385 TaxID=1864822 RepID=UPI00113FFB93|nr:hypothetical protein [Siphonobacter sp. BAB-5385]